jgi:hypothetical protein
VQVSKPPSPSSWFVTDDARRRRVVFRTGDFPAAGDRRDLASDDVVVVSASFQVADAIIYLAYLSFLGRRR